MHNYKAAAEHTDEAERLLTPPFRRTPAPSWIPIEKAKLRKAAQFLHTIDCDEAQDLANELETAINT
jgi:hypothetical protein